jgi:glycosyltransferase involved in cell wall biosynthesis
MRLLRDLLARVRPPPNPSVSIVINTLNRADSLARTLAGLERLKADNFEVIVVAGPCVDHTDQVLERYAGRIRIGRCDVAVLGVSRNIGVDLAAGEIVAFTDDDAVPREDWLTELRRGFDDTVAAAGGFVYDAVMDCMQWRVCTCEVRGRVSIDVPAPHQRYHGPDADPYLYLAGCNMSFRRAAIVAAGGFNESLCSIYDDSEIAGRLHQAGRRIVSTPRALVDHFYEANHARDGKRLVRDPYTRIHDYCVFVLHTRRESEPDAAIAAALSVAEDWRIGGRPYLASGDFTKDQLDDYLRRVDLGLSEGLTAGLLARKIRAFRPAESDAFKPFKG